MGKRIWLYSILLVQFMSPALALGEAPVVDPAMLERLGWERTRRAEQLEQETGRLKEMLPKELQGEVNSLDSTWREYIEAECRLAVPFDEAVLKGAEIPEAAFIKCQIREAAQQVARLQGAVKSWAKDHPEQSSGREPVQAGQIATGTKPGPGEGRVATSGQVVSAGVTSNQPDRRGRPVTECSPLTDLPENVEIHLINIVQGLHPTLRRLPDEVESPHFSEVVVNLPGVPVVLVLGASYPAIWAVRTTPGTNLVAVVAGGRTSLEVYGLDKTVMVRRFLSLPFHGAAPECFFNDAQVYGQLDQVQKSIKIITGRELTRYYDTPTGNRFVVGQKEGIDEKSLRFVAPQDGKDYSDLFSPLPHGQAGLQELIRQGKIRLSTQEDIQLWIKAARERDKAEPSDWLKTVLKQKGHVYSILTRTVLPEVLREDHFSNFILLPGVLPPPDYGANSNFYEVSSGTCFSSGGRRCPQ
ncbi:MAG: hypothetical protein HQL56_17920 [Magnetococcales bacterium]|nr:hypothetical protein [Magnetococcales bacterium]